MEGKQRNHKMVGLYSYNLLDHPEFLRAQRIEKRIIRYNMLQETKRKSMQKQVTLDADNVSEHHNRLRIAAGTQLLGKSTKVF